MTSLTTRSGTARHRGGTHGRFSRSYSRSWSSITSIGKWSSRCFRTSKPSGLSDAQLGGLVSIVSITVALGTVPLSLLADRWSRVKGMFLMAVVWSLATIACAFADSYAHLFAARSVVGLGEAADGAAGAALLASLFPARMRSTILGAFLAAGLFGSVLGVVLGGIISQHWAWQAGFCSSPGGRHPRCPPRWRPRAC